MLIIIRFFTLNYMLFTIHKTINLINTLNSTIALNQQKIYNIQNIHTQLPGDTIINTHITVSYIY